MINHISSVFSSIDTVDHKILLKKLQHYGIKGKNLSWFESYLTGRKQYINFEINDNNGKTDLLKDNMWCTIRVNFRTTTLHNLYKRFMPDIRYLKANHVRR